MLNLKNANVKKLLICYLGLLLMVSSYANACTSQEINICLSEHGNGGGEVACWIKAENITTFSARNLGPFFSNDASGIQLSVTGGSINGAYTMNLCDELNLVDCNSVAPGDFGFVGLAHNDDAESFLFTCD